MNAEYIYIYIPIYNIMNTSVILDNDFFNSLIKHYNTV